MAENWQMRCPDHREHQISLFSGTMAVPVKNVLRNTEIAIMTTILLMFRKLHSELEWNGPSINVSLIAKSNNVIYTDMWWFHFWTNNMTTLLPISGVLAMQPHIFDANAISDVTGSLDGSEIVECCTDLYYDICETVSTSAVEMSQSLCMSLLVLYLGIQRSCRASSGNPRWSGAGPVQWTTDASSRL